MSVPGSTVLLDVCSVPGIELDVFVPGPELDFASADVFLPVVGPPGGPGSQGVPGEQGEQGVPGEAGSDATTYAFNQGVPASVWTIVHNLNRFPSVTVIDSSEREVEGDLKYLDANNLTVSFSAPFSGVAYLN